MFPIKTNANKSSSFYGEEYHQNIRKKSHIKPHVWREKLNPYMDQEHELSINTFYFNQTNKCQMMRYYEELKEMFEPLEKTSKIRCSDYKEMTLNYIQNAWKNIKDFKENRMCDQFATREQLESRMSEEEKKVGDPTKSHAYYELMIKSNEETRCDQNELEPRRLETCDKCQLYIQNFEINFERTIKQLSRHANDWEKLNGGQKLSKFRLLFGGILKGLRDQLFYKCKFSDPHLKRKRIYDRRFR